MKPEYDIDSWIIIGTTEKFLMGIVHRYEESDYRNTIRSSHILGRRGNKVETKNSIYNLLECSIPSDAKEMLDEIEELDNA
jgi:hypothetical protein